ncbi:hypothetical protein [Azotobacter vinelandii]|uniref:hypothetical protein n=1 Tax=Azotobacter vinelandii TaxID=354 RepID=UPI001114AA5E|nr:hypothetical protein [Azotobacter vinelandii]
MNIDPNLLASPEWTTIFEFQNSHTGERFGVTLATLLQCLCIAEQCHLVPPFEADWEKAAIPTAIRSLATICPQEDARK